MKLIYLLPLVVSGAAIYGLATFWLAGSANTTTAILALTAVIVSAVFAWALDNVLQGFARAIDSALQGTAWIFKKLIR